MPSPVLDIQNLCVTYGDMLALDDINLAVNAGEIVGLIGPNGAGKTTLIKALCGRVKASTGTFLIDNTPLHHGRNRQQLLGLVPQDIGLYGHMSARENLIAFAKIMGMKNRQTRATSVNAALDAVDLKHKADERVSALSGGMKRRINVAAAIMHGPRILILDEPTAGADAPARDTVHRLARSIAQTGTAVLLVTHELEQAEALCDKVLLLARGRNLAYAPPTEILTKCFGDTREVMLRFNSPPSPAALSALSAYKFTEGDDPTIQTTMIHNHDENQITKIMNAVRKEDKAVLEISIRRPGLPHLMHILEKTGELPQHIPVTSPC
ncbi:MAG: ABC transporter ATP-binding protein [Maricaulaceae bacterium]